MFQIDLNRNLYRFDPCPEVLDELRDYYLSLPKKTLEGWETTYADTAKLYFVWRHYLKHGCGESLDVNSHPPPIHLRTRVRDVWVTAR